MKPIVANKPGQWFYLAAEIKRGRKTESRLYACESRSPIPLQRPHDLHFKAEHDAMIAWYITDMVAPDNKHQGAWNHVWRGEMLLDPRATDACGFVLSIIADRIPLRSRITFQIAFAWDDAKNDWDWRPINAVVIGKAKPQK